MPLSTGQIVVSIQDDALGCTNPNNPKRYLLSTSGSMTADAVKNIYSALLYASASDKSVTVYFDDATSNCSITRVWVYN
jgi:hypothetical protein